jgi:hypothetical protein
MESHRVATSRLPSNVLRGCPIRPLTRSEPVRFACQTLLERQGELVELRLSRIVLESCEDDGVVALPKIHAIVAVIDGATDHCRQRVLVGSIQNASEPSRRPLGDLNAGDRDHDGGFLEVSGSPRTSQMIGDGIGSGSSGGVGSGGDNGSGPGIGGSGEGGSGVSVGMRAICPGSLSGKRLRHTRELVAVSFTGEPVALAADELGEQDAARPLEN